MATAKSIAETVGALVAPVAEGLGLVLWDVEFVKEGTRHVLRVTIDKEDGVTIDDCEALHRAIDPLLDEADPIDVSYHLEVSSPGIERDLRTDFHIDACEGMDAQVRLFAPVEGQKIFTGVLAGRSETGEILLAQKDGTVRAFPREAVAKIKTIFEF